MADAPTPMNTNRPHVPVPIITHDGTFIIAAANNHPEVAARLPAGYLAAADTLCKKVSADVATQKNAKGELGPLTTAQVASLKILHHGFAQVAKTAKLAFPGQTVKLHQEFQIGAHQNDLRSFLGRIDIVLGSLTTPANLAALKLKGWTDAETTAIQTARTAFGPAEQYRVKADARFANCFVIGLTLSSAWLVLSRMYAPYHDGRFDCF